MPQLEQGYSCKVVFVGSTPTRSTILSMREGRRPLEQPYTRALVNAILDYLLNTHGAIIELIVKDWIADKEKRLAWKRK